MLGKKESKKNEITLTDKQAQILSIHYMEVEQLQNDITRIRKTIEDMSHIILESNGIELKKDQKFNIDFQNKKIIL